MVHVSNINQLKSIYYTYFHSIIKYGIIFGGNSLHDGKIFTLPYKVFRTMAGTQPTTLCSSLFKWLDILPFPYQYSFISIQPWRPGLAGIRAQSCDRYCSGTLHPVQVLGGSLPLLSPALGVPTLAARCLAAKGGTVGEKDVR